MTYVDQIKAATPSDLRDVMRADDPLRDVQATLDELAQLRAFIDVEEAKWQGVKTALELFGAAGPPAPAPPVAPAQTISVRAVVPPTENRREAGAAAKPTIPAQRRRALVGLLRSQPGRTWRTGELAVELQRLEGGAGDLSNLVSRAMTVLESEGLVRRVKKGTFRWIGEQQQFGGEP